MTFSGGSQEDWLHEK